jgi:hypothetical protein
VVLNIWLHPIQVDKRWHKPRGAWDSETHLDQGTGILVDLIKHVQKERPNWSTNWQLKGLFHSLIIISSYSDHRLPPLLQKRMWSRRGEYFLK